MPQVLSFLQTIFVMGVVLGFMILIHEFGHYAAAKLFKVRVEVFSIGFGKRLFGRVCARPIRRVEAIQISLAVIAVETPAFTALVAGYVKDGHKKLPDDLAWLTGRLAEARWRWAIMCRD